MAKKEAKTDLWVARQLDDSKIKYDAQGSDVKEINDALQSASKRGTGNAGYPEYVAVVKDFVIVPLKTNVNICLMFGTGALKQHQNSVSSLQ